MDVTLEAPCFKWIKMLKLSLLCQFAICLAHTAFCAFHNARMRAASKSDMAFSTWSPCCPDSTAVGRFWHYQNNKMTNDTRVCGHQLATPLCSTDSYPQAVVRSVCLSLSPHRTVSALESVCRIYEEVGIYD